MRTEKIPDSINIILNYNNKNLSLIVKRFKKLEIIKEKAYQLFYPIKCDIKIKYNNKDLSSFLDQSIGLIFVNRAKVKLDIDPIIGTKKKPTKTNKIMTNKNLSNLSALSMLQVQTSQAPILTSNLNDRYKSINTEKVHINNNNNILNKYNHNKNNNNKSISPTSSSLTKLPPIKTKNKSKNQISCKDLNINMTERKKNESQLCNDIASYIICRECLLNEIKYYCRKCNTFICVNCNNKKHKKHILLEIDISNQKINIDKYKEELNNKLYYAMNNLDNLDNIESTEVKEDDWSQKFQDAVDNLVKVAQDVKDEIKNNKGNNTDISNNIKNYQNKLKKEVENLKKISISMNEDPFELFNDINRMERIINQIVKGGSNKTNKIEEMFIDIENEIDYALFELEEQMNFN